MVSSTKYDKTVEQYAVFPSSHSFNSHERKPARRLCPCARYQCFEIENDDRIRTVWPVSKTNVQYIQVSILGKRDGIVMRCHFTGISSSKEKKSS